MFQRSVKEFRRAIDLSPHYAPAWCGLGCAAGSGSDPLLAQHAFCRSLELDSLYPDTYANLGFLYTKHNACS
jgi:Flp pilus assembly protein TadD